jgi:putative transposase
VFGVLEVFLSTSQVVDDCSQFRQVSQSITGMWHSEAAQGSPVMSGLRRQPSSSATARLMIALSRSDWRAPRNLIHVLRESLEPDWARRISMKRKRHNAEQVIKKLCDADAMLAGGKTMGQVCQVLEVSEQTFHRRRNQYGGMKAGEAKRLKELEDANRRLKKVVAELTLDKDILQEALKGNY